MSYQFAPYQDDTPDLERAKSPPPTTSPSPRSPPPFRSPPRQPQGFPRPTLDADLLPEADRLLGGGGSAYQNASTTESRGQSLQAFESSLPIRLDYEAVLAYAFPPATGVFLLIFEHKSDYVRFHAWQSSMLFTAVFLLHLLLSWSKILSWMLLVVDLVLILFLAQHAYRDVENLDHFEVPFFGRLANSFVDDE